MWRESMLGKRTDQLCGGECVGGRLRVLSPLNQNFSQGFFFFFFPLKFITCTSS